MTLFESHDAFTPQRIHESLERGKLPKATSYVFLLLFLLPIIAEIIALTIVSGSSIVRDHHIEFIGILEASSAYLPVIDKFLLAGSALLPHAFAHLIGFWSALIALVLLLVWLPSAPLLITCIHSSSKHANHRGHSFKSHWLVLLVVGVSAIVFVSQFFGIAGTKNVVLYYETSPRPDLLKFERLLRYLLDNPLLYSIVSGAMWGGFAVIWRYAILIVGNLHHISVIHSVWLDLQKSANTRFG